MNLKNQLPKIAIVITLLSINFTVPGILNAQAKNYAGLIIRTDPSKVRGLTYEFFMSPGESVCDSFIAQHDFEQENLAAGLYTIVSDLVLEPGDSTPKYPKGTLILENRYSLAAWVKMDEAQVVLPYWGYEKEVKFCINAPSDAGPGAHYANIFLSTVTPDQYVKGGELTENPSFTGAGIGQRVGVNIIVNIKGEVKAEMQVRNFRVADMDGNPSSNSLFEYVPLSFISEIDNVGNTFVIPSGNLSIHRGNLAQPTKFMEVNDTGLRIYPESNLTFNNKWEDGFLQMVKTETGKAENGDPIYAYSLKVDTQKLSDIQLGRYYATLQLRYRDNNGEIIRLPDVTIEFWVLPWKLLLGAIVSLTFLFLVYRTYRHYRNRGVHYITSTGKGNFREHN